MGFKFVDGWRKFMSTEQRVNQRKSMKDMLWERKDNWKVDRMIFERVLFEGRLEDVKKRYPQYEEHIDVFSRHDPSGNNKYLAKMVKLFDAEVRHIRDARGLDPAAEVSSMMSIRRSIIRRIEDFHKFNKYMPAEQGGRDINSYKTSQDIYQAVENAKAKFEKKEADKVHKERIRQDADRIYQDKTTLIVRPKSEAASCYYGQGTQWCISATKSRNYWDDYANEQGAVFIFILDKDEELKEEGLDKVALVYNSDNVDAESPYDSYDSADDQLSSHDVVSYYHGAWDQDKINAVFGYDGAIQQSLNEDPPEPGVDLDEAVEELEEYAARENKDDFPVNFHLETDWEGTGIEAYANVRYAFDSEGISDERLQQMQDRGEFWDLVEHTIEESLPSSNYHDMEWYVGGTELYIDVTINCEVCGGGPTREARERAVAGAREFIDMVLYDFVRDYSDENEVIRQELSKIGALPKSEWEYTREHLVKQVEKLEHIDINTDDASKIIFTYVEPDGSLPILGKSTAAPVDASFSPQEILQRVDAQAQEFAKRQMALNLGDKYDTSPSSAPVFPEHHVRHGLVNMSKKQLALNLELVIRRGGSGEELEMVENYLAYLNDKYDTILAAFREEYEARVSDIEGDKKIKQSKIQSGEAIEQAIAEIEKTISNPAWKFSEYEPEIREVTDWLRRNFPKMKPVERNAAAAYLEYVQDAIKGGTVSGVYMFRGKAPLFWKDKFLKTALANTNMPVTKADAWIEDSQSRLTESVRQRVRQVISERLKG